MRTWKKNKKDRETSIHNNAYNIIWDDGSIICFSFVNDPFHLTARELLLVYSKDDNNKITLMV